MSTSFVILPVMILFFLLVTAVPVIMGLFVFRDAKARGMDPLLWTLVAVFAPGFIGLIIYLIMRKDHVKLTCPSCGNEVQQTFVSCPNCGQKLCASCGNCGSPLSTEWKLCPQCGAEITGSSDFSPPVATKPDNKGFLIAILAIMAVPLALIIIAVCLFVYSSVPMSGEDDSQTLYDLAFEMGIEQVCVTSSDACNLSDSQIEWIKEKKAGEKGIYSTTFSLPAWGELENAQYTGTYNFDIDYTIVVINPENGSSYVGKELSYNTIDFFPEMVNITLEEADANDEEAVQYGNVFVIKTISRYSLEWNYKDGREPEKLEKEHDASEKIITLNIENSDRLTYKIPCVYEKDQFIPFN